MYTYNKYSQGKIKVSCRSYSYVSFSQLTIFLKAYVYKLKAVGQVTFKQDLFGSHYQETSTQLVIKKSDLQLTVTPNNNAESLLVALFIKWLSNNKNLVNASISQSEFRIEDGYKKFAYWLQLIDLPLDENYNIDVSLPIDPDNF